MAKKKSTSATAGANTAVAGGEEIVNLDPSIIYFTFSRIRPCFSCGRTIESTMEQFQRGELSPKDLPLLLVFVSSGQTAATSNGGGGGGGDAAGKKDRGDDKGTSKRKNKKGKRRGDDSSDSGHDEEDKAHPSGARTSPGEPPQVFYFSQNNRRLYMYKELHAKGMLDTIPVRLKPLPQTRRMAQKYTPEKCALTATLQREGAGKANPDDSGASSPGSGADESGSDEGA